MPPMPALPVLEALAIRGGASRGRPIERAGPEKEDAGGMFCGRGCCWYVVFMVGGGFVADGGEDPRVVGEEFGWVREIREALWEGGPWKRVGGGSRELVGRGALSPGRVAVGVVGGRRSESAMVR